MWKNMCIGLKNELLKGKYPKIWHCSMLMERKSLWW